MGKIRKTYQKSLLYQLAAVTAYRSFQIMLLAVLISVLIVLWLNKNHLPVTHQYGYFGLFLANFLASSTVVLPLPGIAAVFLGGGLWNPFLVGLSAGAGATLGEVTGFMTGFIGGKVLKPPDKKGWFKILNVFFMRNGFITILIAAAMPIPFFDIIGLTAGILRYPILKFVLATFIGRVVRDVAIAWSGAKFLPY